MTTPQSQALRSLAEAIAQIEDHPVLAGLTDPANLCVAAAADLERMADVEFELARARGLRPFTSGGRA